MDNPFNELAKRLQPPETASIPVTGKVTSWPDQYNPGQAQRVIVDGTTQEAADLLKNDSIDRYGLTAGDLVLMQPIEERQRYIILCKVVGV